MSEKAMTLYDAIQNFLGPMHAEYCRIITDSPPDTEVTILLGGYEYKTTMDDIQKLDRAYARAFDIKCKRDENKAKGTLL